MNAMKQRYELLIDEQAQRVRSGKHSELFAQLAQTCVAFGRETSPFIPVGADYHMLANHKNRLMQEIVRSPAHFEIDPLRPTERPAAGKRAPHILWFRVPVEGL
jgi:hypothetical protein